MSQGPDEREADLESHPLAGVLDRLIRRERGAPPAEPATARPSPSPAVEPARRRVVVVAGFGTDAGAAAVLHLARWGVERGLRVAAVDLSAEPVRATEPSGTTVPLASLPNGIEGLRLEPAETVRAVIERLRRLEAGSDLLVVRVPVSSGRVLARAAFLAGGIVLPVGTGDKALHEALWLSRSLLDSLPGLALVPYSTDDAAIARYMEILREFHDAGSDSLEIEDLAGLDAIPPLADGSGEGFLAALIGESLSGESQTVLEIGKLAI